MVSSGHPRDSVLYMHESILPQTLPILAATEHWAEFPVLDSRTLLVIHFKYIRVYMSIPSSLTFPSWLLYLLVTMRSFSVSFLICIVSFYSEHINDIIQYFSLSELLHSVWEFLVVVVVFFLNCYKLYSCMFYVFLFCVKFSLGWGVFSV